MRNSCHFDCSMRTIWQMLLLSLFYASASVLMAQGEPPDSGSSLTLKGLDEIEEPQMAAEEDVQVGMGDGDETQASKNSQTKSVRGGIVPSAQGLIEAKLSALKRESLVQEQELAKADRFFYQEDAIERKTFDINSYLAISIINSAPTDEYRLRNTEVYLDGKLVARGGKRHAGLPVSKDIFFGAIEPGCHELWVKAKYIRLKNDLISRFKVDRIERIEARQPFIAKDGYRIEIGIEGFEAQSSLASFYRGPQVRFNRTVIPNFLPGAPIVSLDDVLKEGRVRISFVDEKSSQYRLIKKSLEIDGLRILNDTPHDQKKEDTLVFDAPLAEGKHKLSTTLTFGEKKWIKGGAEYNFRLRFNRDFYVISGQTTLINLTGMPKGGISNVSQKSRFASAKSQIKSEQYKEFFPDETCEEILAKEQAKFKNAATEVDQPKMERPDGQGNKAEGAVKALPVANPQAAPEVAPIEAEQPQTNSSGAPHDEDPIKDESKE